MRKKIPAGKGITKAGEKKLPKEIKAAPITPKKTVSRKKDTKQTVATKKISAAKVKPGAKGNPIKAEEKKSGKTVGKISPKRKAPAKKATVKKEKTPPAKVTKKPALKKTVKILKGKKSPQKEKPEKAVAKSKPLKSPISLKAARERTSAVGNKKKIRRSSKSRSKVTEKSGSRSSVLKKKTQSARTRQEISNREIKEDLFPLNPAAPSMPLPSEYGENDVSLLTVNPSRLFAFWEIREETLRIFQGYPKLRLYDVSDADIDSMNAGSYIDIEIDNRIGDRYISVSPGKDYFADIGILYSGGIFIGLARSLKVSTPYGMVAEEEVVPERISDNDMRVGY